MTPLFYLGAMSPYSWFAAERIGELLPAARWHGVFAGGLFKACGRVSWGLTDRRLQGIADCEARARRHGLGPIEWPDPWPTSDLLIARAMSYVEGLGQDGCGLPAFALCAMRLAFREGADLGAPAAVLETAARCGLQEARVRDALTAQAVKDALRLTTDGARELGVFGVPTVVVAGECFWGDDRLEDAARAFRRLPGA